MRGFSWLVVAIFAGATPLMAEESSADWQTAPTVGEGTQQQDEFASGGGHEGYGKGKAPVVPDAPLVVAPDYQSQINGLKSRIDVLEKSGAGSHEEISKLWLDINVLKARQRANTRSDGYVPRGTPRAHRPHRPRSSRRYRSSQHYQPTRVSFFDYVKRQLGKLVKSDARQDRRLDALEKNRSPVVTPNPATPTLPVTPPAPTPAPVTPQTPATGGTPIPGSPPAQVPGGSATGITYIPTVLSQPATFQNAVWLVNDETTGETVQKRITLEAYIVYDSRPVSDTVITLCDGGGKAVVNSEGQVIQGVTGTGGGVRFAGMPAGTYRARLDGTLPTGLFALAASKPFGTKDEQKVSFQLVDAQGLIDGTVDAMVARLEYDGYIVKKVTKKVKDESPKPSPTTPSSKGTSPKRVDLWLFALITVVAVLVSLVLWRRRHP